MGNRDVAYLNEEDYENISEDDHEAFVSLASISRQRLYETETDNSGNLSWEAVMDYMNEVTALAHQLGIDGIHYNADYDQYHAEYARFVRTVEYQIAQIRIQKARRNRKSSISISGAGRERIQHYLERIKEEIRNAEIQEKRKQALLDRIADFEAEMTKKALQSRSGNGSRRTTRLYRCRFFRSTQRCALTHGRHFGRVGA